MIYVFTFPNWTGKPPIIIDSDTITDATKKLVARLCDLSYVKLDGKPLFWQYQTHITIGPCGRRRAFTTAYFLADGSEPIVHTGCFVGTLAEFREAIHRTHVHTIFEPLYNAVADHIATIFQIQKDELLKGI